MVVSLALIETHYPSITHAIVDLRLKKQKAVLFNHIDGRWDDLVQKIVQYANSLFESTTGLIGGLAWEALYAVKQIPNYLVSLLRVVEQLIGTSNVERATNLVNAFLAGSTKLWEFMENLIPGAFGKIAEQIKSFAQLLKTYGNAVFSAVKYLFSGVKTVLTAILTLYAKASEKLALFSSAFVNAINYLPNMNIRKASVQTVLFAFMMMQNVMELGSIKSTVAFEYIQAYALRLSKQTTTLNKMVNALNPMSFIATILKHETIQNLLGYMSNVAAAKPFAILSAIFQFAKRIIKNVTTCISSYITGFVFQGINTLSDILKRIFGMEEHQDDFQNLTRVCNELAANKDVSPENREKLAETVKLSSRLQESIAAVSSSKYNNLTKLFDDTWFASNVYARFYFEEQVSAEEENRMCENVTGFDKETFEFMSLSMSALLQERISVVYAETFSDTAKVKVESFIGSDLNWDKEQYEKEKEIKAIDQKIPELEKAIRSIKYNNESYRIKKGDYDKQEAQFMQNLTAPLDVRRVHLKFLKEIKRNIEEEAGITALEKEITELKVKREELQRSIHAKRGLVKRNSGKLILLITGLVFGYIAWTIKEKLEHDAQLAAQTVFKPLLKAANYDPILAAEIRQFTESQGVSIQDNTPLLISKFEAHVSNTIYDIRNGKTSFEEVEKTWGLLIMKSVRLHQERPIEEASKSVVVKAIDAFYNFWKGEKVLDVPQIEAAAAVENAIEKTFDKTAVGLLKDINPVQVFQGWQSYTQYNSVAEKKEAYAMQVSQILASHFVALSGTFALEHKRISEDEVGWLKGLGNLISYGLKQGGLYGADKDASAKDLQESLAKGGFPFLMQQFAYYEGTLVMVTSSIRLILTIIVAVANSVLNIYYGEHDIAGKFMKDLYVEVFVILGVAGAQIIKAATVIFFGRWNMIIMALNLLSTLVSFTPFGIIWSVLGGLKRLTVGAFRRLTSARSSSIIDAGKRADSKLEQEVGYATAKAELKRRMLQKESLTKQESNINCNACIVQVASAACGHCRNTFYCSEGCADLNWIHHASKH